MDITISGNLTNIIKTVNKYVDLENKVLEIAKQLCAIGEPIIRQTHGNHAVIITEPIENGYKITADGEDILFIEFGTGDMAGVMDSLYDSVPGVVGQGTWSETHAQMYSKYGFWVFGGQIYRYTEPHPAFYYAYQAMVEALPQIAQEVMNR